MGLISILILAAIPFAIAPIVVLSDNKLFERKPERRLS